MTTENRQVEAMSVLGADKAGSTSSTMTGRIRESLPDIVFWSVAVLMLFWSLGVKGLWGPEDRWAEVVREMRLTGDYFHPTINGRPYFDKPLLGYWLIALCAAVTGRIDEGIVRLPSAIAGLLALGGTISLGQKLWSASVARTAGWILLGSYGFVFWARTGEADMENLAAIILAVAWYWHRREKPGFFSYLVFYLICFVGAHTKGMATIAVPVLVLLPDMIRERRWRSYLSVSHALALLVGLSVYLMPFILSDTTRTGYHASGLALAIRENITRYFQPFDHKEPFYVYLYYVPKWFFPWVPLLVGAIWLFCRRFRTIDRSSQWLAVASALIFLFFTLSGSRRSYYILPILPFCALMVSLYVTFEQPKPRKRILDIQKGVFFLIVVAEILFPLAWPVLRKHVNFVMSRQLLVATLLLGGLGLTGGILLWIRPDRMAQILGVKKEVVGLIAMSVIVIGGLFGWQGQMLDSYRSTKPFSLALKDYAQSAGVSQVAFYRKFPIQTLFYMDLPEPVLLLEDVNAVKLFLNSTNETRILVSHYDYDSELAAVLPEDMAGWPTMEEEVYPWEKEKNYEAWIVKDCKLSTEPDAKHQYTTSF